MLVDTVRLQEHNQVRRVVEDKEKTETSLGSRVPKRMTKVKMVPEARMTSQKRS